MREMILHLHSVLYAAQLSKMGMLGQAFAKCRSKFSIWSTWLSCMKEFAVCISWWWARNSAGNLQRWSWTRSTAPTSETTLQRCLQRVGYLFLYSRSNTNFVATVSLWDCIFRCLESRAGPIRCGSQCMGAGPMPDLSAGPLWAVILWRHRVQSTVLRSWQSANMQYSTNTSIEHVC